MPVRAVTLVALVAVASPLSAHRLTLTVRDRGERIEAVATFDDGTAAVGCTVTVRPAGRSSTLVEGSTDSSGTWSFVRPEPGRYSLIADDRRGHRAGATLTVPGPGEGVTVEADVSPSERERNWWIGVVILAATTILGVTFWVCSRRSGRATRQGGGRLSEPNAR